MPSTDRNDSDDLQDRERDRDDRDREKGGKSKSAASKAKDLSHVPCKFYKVGSCTAGASCPFSHTTLQDTGGQKEVCAWFVKGNCKFGHKCALAHVLPGQAMAMDRKNKKAAQLAAGGGGGAREARDGGRGGRGQRREGQGPSGDRNAPMRNSLLSGSSAPTRALPSSRGPITMPLKATISPSAPAPPLQDTDFSSLGLPDENTQSASTPAQNKQAQEAATPESVDEPVPNVAAPKAPSPGPLPVSTPTAPRRLIPSHRSSPSVDFGPVGSPPRSVTSGTSATRINGFSPGSSPAHQNNYLSTSPFSAPAQSVFRSLRESATSSPSNQSSDFKSRSGLAASLGATQTWNTEFGPVPSQVQNRTSSRNYGKAIGSSGAQASGEGFEVFNEDEMEDFIPGSLTDLLTPAERSRRQSRSNSGQIHTLHSAHDGNARPSHYTVPADNDDGGAGLHRYSRSVPASSLLGDIRSIWSDNGASSVQTAGLPASQTDPLSHNFSGIGSGTPSSYKSGSGFGGRSYNDDNSLSMLSPSNASAAFLPSLHHHYLNSKAKQSGLGSTLRAPGSSLYPAAQGGIGGANNMQASTTYSASHLHSAFDNRNNQTSNNVDTSNDSYYNGRNPVNQNGGNNGFGYAGNGLGANNGGGDMTIGSPSARALQSHAPGQSLPQGLAAGYSRIHALPPPTVIPSPGGGGFSYGQSVSPNVSHEWSTLAIGANAISPDTNSANLAANANAGLGAFSRLSYSAAAARPTSTSNPALSSNAGPPGIPPTTMPRNASGGGRQWGGPLSPLSGPVVTGDDDDLFSMDG